MVEQLEIENTCKVRQYDDLLFTELNQGFVCSSTITKYFEFHTITSIEIFSNIRVFCSCLEVIEIFKFLQDKPFYRQKQLAALSPAAY